MVARSFAALRWERDDPHRPRASFAGPQTRGAGPWSWLPAHARRGCRGGGAGSPPWRGAQPQTADSNSRSWSLLVTSDMNIKPQHAVLVAHGHDGDVLINVVLHLDHGLRGLGEIGDIGESDVVVDLLFDRDPRDRVVLLPDELGIDLHPAASGPEEPLYPAIDGGVQGLTQDGIGGVVCGLSGSGLPGLARIVNIPLARPPEGK